MQQDRDIENIVDMLIKKVAPYVIILFGSYGKGLARKDSDIDIAYLTI